MKGVESRQCLQTRNTRDEECYSSPGVPNPGTFLCNRKIVPRPLATTHNGSTLANENWSQSTLVLPLRRGLSPAGNRRSVTVEGVRSTAQQPTLFIATRTHTVIQGGKSRPAHRRNLKQKKGNRLTKARQTHASGEHPQHCNPRAPKYMAPPP